MTVAEGSARALSFTRSAFRSSRSRGGGTTVAADPPLIINFPAMHTPVVFIAAGYYRRTFKFCRPPCRSTGWSVLLNVAGRDWVIAHRRRRRRWLRHRTGTVIIVIVVLFVLWMWHNGDGGGGGGAVVLAPALVSCKSRSDNNTDSHLKAITADHLKATATDHLKASATDHLKATAADELISLNTYYIIILLYNIMHLSAKYQPSNGLKT